MELTDRAKKMLEQYDQSKNATSGTNRVSKEERLKKYFTTVLPKGTKDGERRIRILPTKDGGTPFVDIKFHEIQVGGDYLKLYDPKQEGKRSPLNEVYESLRATGIESDAELAKSYRSRTFYIVKIIDRDNEQDGPKFWRFKYNSKSEGPLDKIAPIIRNKGDITDPIEGRDLILSLSLTKSGNGKEYTTINSIIPDDKSPLHTDSVKVEEWVNDELIWSDVYAKRSEDYLEMVARGETPRWDVENKKWVSATSSEVVIGGQLQKTPITPEDPQSEEEPDEELPF